MVIDRYDSLIEGGTPFKDKGYVFYEAWEETGLDPIYLLCHAAIESGWGNSRISKEKHNYFGIAAYDTSPYQSALTMGSGVETGIKTGAKWIKENYYDTGKTSLALMSAGGYSTTEEWDETIADMIADCYTYITKNTLG